jgi:SAM-dependent methyltransferase
MLGEELAAAFGGRRALRRVDHPWRDDLLAALYDAFPFDADVPLYLRLAGEQAGAVLELACGTGRLLVPLAAAGHRVPGGLLVLDLLHPSPEWLQRPAGSLRQDLLEELPDGGAVARTEAVVGTDLAAQVRTLRSAYEVVGPDGTVRTCLVEWPFRYTFRFEAEHLLERAGFEVEAVHGGYRGEPFRSDSPVLLLVARRAA